jgi:hypothetical protein
MKTLITSLLRHSLTALAGLGTLLAARGCVAEEDAEAVNAAGTSMIEVLVVVLAAIFARLLIFLLGKAKNGNGSGGGQLYGLGGCLLFMTVGAGSLLSASCAQYPISGGLTYYDVESGAKGGLSYTQDGVARASLTVPIRDPETGKEIGRATIGGAVGKSSK